ncbi:MAG: hypothetical protein AAGE99_05910, partial [Chlamydiota bacterium]
MDQIENSSSGYQKKSSNRIEKEIGKPPSRRFDYHAIIKAAATFVALTATSAVAMKRVRHYTKWAITPLRKNLALGLFAVLNVMVVVHLYGPFTKDNREKDDPKPNDPEKNLDRLGLSTSSKGANEPNDSFKPECKVVDHQIDSSNDPNRKPSDLQENLNRSVLSTSSKGVNKPEDSIGSDFEMVEYYQIDPKPNSIASSMEIIGGSAVPNRNGSNHIASSFLGESIEMVKAMDRNGKADGKGNDLSMVRNSIACSAVIIDNPACPEPSIKIEAVDYNEKVHGKNGDRMKQKLYKSLLDEYARLLRQEIDKPPMEKLLQTEAISYFWRSSGEHALMYALHYLLREDSKSTQQARYEAFIQAHTKLMNDYQGREETYNRDILRWSRAIAVVRMTPGIQSYQESLVAAHYKVLPTNMKAQSFHQVFAMRNNIIRTVDSRMKLSYVRSTVAKIKGAVSLCNYFTENPPNLRKVETWIKGGEEGGDSRQIFHLRHSTPHAGAIFTTSSVDLAYREFLKATEEQAEGVIYAIHQRLDDYGAKFEQEGYRVQSILDLEPAHPNLLILVQSVESDLFKNWKGRTFKELQEAILDSFRQKEGSRRNRLPRCLMAKGRLLRGKNDEETLRIEPDYEAELGRIFDFVREVFFSGRREEDAIDTDKVNYYQGLTKPDHLTCEAQAFIMLFYHFQREHLKFA